MAAAEIRDYLEKGSIHNSVNYPEVQLGDPEAVRVLVLHELPSKHALDTLAELPGIIRIRTFTKE